jgi:signal peptidase II
MKRLAILAYATALIVVVIDQAAKAWISRHFAPGATEQILPFVGLTLISNTGVSYGLFSGGASLTRWLLAAFSGGVAIGLAVWIRNAARPLSALGVGLIIGGAVGNLIDRVRLGAVVDFIDARALHFPWIFNPADAAISVGVALFLLELLIFPDKKPVSDAPAS